MGTMAAVVGGGALLNTAGSIYGARKQGRALNRATDQQRDFQNRLLGFQEQVYDEGAPFRAAALERLEGSNDLWKENLPSLLGEAQATGMSGSSKIALDDALRLIRQNAATTGDPDSGASQISQGQAGARFAAHDNDRRFQMMMQLLGLGGDPNAQANAATNQSLSLLGQAGQNQNAISDLTVGKGAVQGGLYSSIGRNLSDMGLMYGMGMFNQGGGGGGATGVPVNTGRII